MHERQIMTIHNEANRRSALVTGATSGIGKAAALRLAADGFHVLVHGRDADRGAAVVAEIEKNGGSASFVAADLTEVDAVKKLAEAAADVEVLVNNAGFAWFGPTGELTPETFDALFAANVRSAYFLVAELAPKMVQRGGGNIINLGSMAGQMGLAGGAAYSATKASLAAFTRAWAAEFSPSGVRVNTIAPGPVYTGAAAADFISAQGEQLPIGRAAQAEEIGDAIGFLASHASAYITGAVIPVDGGATGV